MFKLIKLAMYGLLGYALYELYLGVMQQQGQGQGAGGGQQRQGGQSGGQAGRMTGGGGGRMERSEESSSGMSTSHAVGRGVVS